MNRLKEEILEEILMLLRKNSTCDKKNWFKLLNSPFIVTFLGGIIIVLITLYWQFSQYQYAMDLEHQKSLVQQKYNLFNNYSSLFTKKAHLVNEYMIRVFKIASKELDEKTIQKEIKELYKLYKEYRQMGAPGILLIQIEYLFEKHDVKENTREMKDKWLEFARLFNQVNNAYRTNQLNNENVKEYKIQRKSLLKICQEINNKLIISILAELSRASEK